MLAETLSLYQSKKNEHCRYEIFERVQAFEPAMNPPQIAHLILLDLSQ